MPQAFGAPTISKYNMAHSTNINYLEQQALGEKYNPVSMHNAITQFWKNSRNHLNDKITVRVDLPWWQDLEMKEREWQDIKKQIQTYNPEGIGYIMLASQRFEFIVPMTDLIEEHLNKWYPGHNASNDGLRHFAMAIYLEERFGVAVTEGTGILVEVAGLLHHGMVSAMGFTGTTGFSADDLAANFAGYMGYSASEAYEHGIFLHTEEENFGIGQGKWKAVGDKIKKLKSSNNQYKMKLTGEAIDVILAAFKLPKSDQLTGDTDTSVVTYGPTYETHEITIGEFTREVAGLDDLDSYNQSYFKNEFMSRCFAILVLNRGMSFLDIYAKMKARYPGFLLSDNVVNKFEAEFCRILKRTPKVIDTHPQSTSVYNAGLTSGQAEYIARLEGTSKGLIVQDDVRYILDLTYSRLVIKVPHFGTLGAQAGYTKYLTWWIDRVIDCESTFTKATNSESSAYSYNQFTVPAVPTAFNRYKNAHNDVKGSYNLPAWVNIPYPKSEDITKAEQRAILDNLTYDQEAALSLANTIAGLGRNDDIMTIAQADSIDALRVIAAAKRLYIVGHMQGTWDAQGKITLPGHTAEDVRNVIKNMAAKMTVQSLNSYK